MFTDDQMKQDLKFRLAEKDDLPAIIRLLRDDQLGSMREAEASHLYDAAMDAIVADPNHELTVAEMNKEVIGTFHLVVIQHLTHQAMKRAQIEGVRVDSRFRRRGIGKTMLRYAVERGRQRGCGVVQLTTDKRRAEAVPFYESIGFVASHTGMKLELAESHSSWSSDKR